MAQKGLYLDGDPVSLPNGITSFALNAELDNNGVSYQNAKGFTIALADSGLSNILGVCELPNGVILFGRANDNKSIVVIKYYIEIGDTLRLVKSIDSSYIKSDSVETVSAVYTYNYKKELILNICFTEQDDIYLINMSTFDTKLVENADYMRNMVLIPDIMFPVITKAVVAGSLYPATYQFAIQYKLDTEDYTDFSPLTPPVTICHKSSASYEKPTLEGIQLTIGTAKSSYKSYRIAIIKISPTAQEGYVTKDFPSTLGKGAIKTITNLENYDTIPVDAVLIKTIPVIGANDCAINNNRLLLTNIKINTIDKDIIDSIKTRISTERQGVRFIISTPKFTERLFMLGEIYVFYLAIYDIKGKISTVVPIPIKMYNSKYPLTIIDGYGLLIKPSISTGTSKLNAVAYDLSVNLSDLANINTRGQVSGYSILIAEHNESNSVILSHALAIRDGYKLWGEGPQYAYQNLDPDTLRVYPFEYLYNKQASIVCNIQKQYNYLVEPGGQITGYFTHNRTAAECPVDFGGGADNFKYGCHATINDSRGGFETTSIVEPIGDLVFVNPLSEAEHNIQGDSFFRCKTTPNTFMPSHNYENSGHHEWVNTFPLATNKYGNDATIKRILANRIFKLYLVNKLYNESSLSGLLNKLYGDLKSQKIAVATPFIGRGNTGDITLSGDSYYDIFGVRVKGPGHSFSITQAEKNDDVSSIATKTGNTNQIIIYGHVISKYNLGARYQEKPDIHAIVFKEGNKGLDKDWSNDNYEYDTNFGHNEGEIYSKVFNENGIEHYAIENESDSNKINVLQNRIIRSDVIGSESLSLGWRNFRPTSYTDVDSSKGEIISIKSSDKNIYIQCRYGLKINAIKDVLNISEAENTYLGTGDLFDRQSVEIMYSPIGYIGCSNKNHCYYSTFGYIVIDVSNKRIFLINEQGVHCLSDKGISEWCKNHLHLGFNYSISVDQNNKTLYIHCCDGSVENINNYDQIADIDRFRKFTLAYSFITGTFISFHSWIVDRGFCASRYYMLPNGDANTQILALSETERGVYGYDGTNAVYCPTILKLLFTDGKKGSQLLKSLIWDTKHYTNGNLDNTKTFNSIFVHTANQASKVLDIDISASITDWWDSDKGSNQRDLYQFNAFNDVLLDGKILPVSNLLTGYTPITTFIDKDSMWFDKLTFINTYFFVVFAYTNADANSKLVINTVAVDTIQNYR